MEGIGKVTGIAECHECSQANPEIQGDQVLQASVIYLFWGLELFPTVVLAIYCFVKYIQEEQLLFKPQNKPTIS